MSRIISKTSLYSISKLYKFQNTNSKYILPKLPHANILTISDIGYRTYNEPNINDLFKQLKDNYQHILLVIGNSDYYHTPNYQRKYIASKIRDICIKNNIILLDNNDIYIHDIHFFGTTLWSLIRNESDSQDFIKNVFRDKYEYQSQFFNNYNWLKDALDKYNFDERQVILTHHLPFLFQKHNSSHGTDLINSYINMKNVKYWISGNSDNYYEYKYKKINHIVNPVNNIYMKKKEFSI